MDKIDISWFVNIGVYFVTMPNNFTNKHICQV